MHVTAKKITSSFYLISCLSWAGIGIETSMCCMRESTGASCCYDKIKLVDRVRLSAGTICFVRISKKKKPSIKFNAHNVGVKDSKLITQYIPGGNKLFFI